MELELTWQIIVIISLSTRYVSSPSDTTHKYIKIAPKIIRLFRYGLDIFTVLEKNDNNYKEYYKFCYCKMIICKRITVYEGALHKKYQIHSSIRNTHTKRLHIISY